MKQLFTSTRPSGYKLVQTRSIFIITLIVIPLTIIGIYAWGVGQHRTFFENSILSTTILSIAFFLFITINLYRGVKLKDNIGYLKPGKPNLNKTSPDFTSHMSLPDMDFGGADDGCAGVVISFLLWIVFSIALILFVLFFEAVIAAAIVAFIAMLYWIFFRALRLVFKNSNKSKDNLMESIRYGLTYTLLYNSWIYLIILTLGYLKK